MSHKITATVAKVLLSGLITFIPLSSMAAQKPARWVEVEVIIFTRETPDDSIREEFPQKVSPIRYHRNRDLLTPYHYPKIRHLFNAIGLCDAEQALWATPPMPRIEDVVTMPVGSSINGPADETIAVVESSLAPLPSSAFQPIGLEPGLTAEQMTQMGIGPMVDFIEPDLTTLEPLALPTKQSCIADNPWFTPFKFISEDPDQDRSFDYHYDNYPRVIDAGEKYNDLRVHLMTKRNFRLRDIYRTLRSQPNTRPILHTAWRQPAGAKRRMRATRLYGGIDFSEHYDFQGNPIIKDELLTTAPLLAEEVEDLGEAQAPAQTTSVVDNIERLLTLVDNGANINYQTQSIEPVKVSNNTDDPTQVREVDGLFKIWIDGFNYLHVDAEFNLRREGISETLGLETTIDSLLQADVEPEQPPLNSSLGSGLSNSLVDQQALSSPIPPNELHNYHFKQTRRLITKELHYFDHPYMGMIILLRRWGW